VSKEAATLNLKHCGHIVILLRTKLKQKGVSYRITGLQVPFAVQLIFP